MPIAWVLRLAVRLCVQQYRTGMKNWSRRSRCKRTKPRGLTSTTLSVNWVNRSMVGVIACSDFSSAQQSLAERQVRRG